MTTINATEISRDDLEKMAMKILTSHSIADVSRRTAMSYANLWNIRKSSDKRSRAYDRTLVEIINAFPNEIK